VLRLPSTLARVHEFKASYFEQVPLLHWVLSGFPTIS
jgi:hypothetical protein